MGVFLIWTLLFNMLSKTALSFPAVQSQVHPAPRYTPVSQRVLLVFIHRVSLWLAARTGAGALYLAKLDPSDLPRPRAHRLIGSKH